MLKIKSVITRALSTGFLASVCFMVQADEPVFWTVTASNGVMATSSGTLAINIGSTNTPQDPSVDIPWQACTSNWIYFNRSLDGVIPSDKHLNRMLSVALGAQKIGNKIRVSISRSEINKCYTTEISDLGY